MGEREGKGDLTLQLYSWKKRGGGGISFQKMDPHPFFVRGFFSSFSPEN